MKKRILSGIALFLCAVMLMAAAPASLTAEENAHYLDINKTNIPDANFRSWIIDNLYISGSSGAYYMTKDQVTSVTEMNLKDQNIKNAKGIEKFTSLTKLVFWNNSLSKLDVSKNTKLTYLDLDNNQISELDLSKNTKLATLYCSGNRLGYLRLNKNTALTSGTIGTQTVTGKKGAIIGGKYKFDLGQLIPLDLMKYVTMNNGTLNTSTGVVTFDSKINSFEYTFSTGNDNRPTIGVTVIVDEYVSLSKPKVTTQPKTITKKSGETAKFTVKASGGQLGYQWQMRTSSSGSWKNISGATSASYSFKVASKHSGYQFRCVVRNAAGKVTSKAATLKMTIKPKITTQPKNVTVEPNTKAKFTVKAVGTSIKYQWQYRKSSSGSWKSLTTKSAKTATLTVTAKASMNGYQYRCKLKNAYGTVTTKVVKLSVGAPKITGQPKTAAVSAGKTAKFTVKATGNELKFQWQYRTSKSGDWKTLKASNAVKMTATTTATLEVKATAKMNGYQYRCIVSNKYGKATSKVATLKIDSTNYRALLIGEEYFTWDTTHRNRADAEHMRDMLATVTGPTGSKKYKCTLKFDQGYSDVENAIKKTFADTKSDDVSMFFIATHGNSDGDGELALTDNNDLDFGTLAGWLAKYVKGDIIVIIESCGAGSAIYNGLADTFDTNAFTEKAIEAFKAEEEREMNAGVGAMRRSRFYVLAAAAHHEMSWGHEGSTPGNYFTDWLIEGIGSSGRMPADSDNNKIVTLKELYKYIQQYDSYTFQGTYHQHVKAYPETSTYKLFKRN